MDVPSSPGYCLLCLSSTVWIGSAIHCCRSDCNWSGADSKVDPPTTWRMYQNQVASMLELRAPEDADRLKRMLVIEPAEAVRPIEDHRRSREELREAMEGNHQERKRRMRNREAEVNNPPRTIRMRPGIDEQVLSEREQALIKRRDELAAIQAQKRRDMGLDREPKTKQRKQPDRDLLRHKRRAARKARKTNR